MTESEWLSCADPSPMLEFLRGKASDRRARLFACACCRSVWDFMTEPECRRAVEVAELFADRRVSDKERLVARRSAVGQNLWAAPSIAATRNGNFIQMAISCAWHAARPRSHRMYEQQLKETPGKLDLAFAASKAASMTEQVTQSRLVREIFGNPFRAVAINQSWLTRNVCALSDGIYEERAFYRLPVLADALEEAGCDNADILNHCRQPGEHVRGCWVVDLVLAKQ